MFLYNKYTKHIDPAIVVLTDSESIKMVNVTLSNL